MSWTDGVGVLQSGTTGSDGALVLQHVSPERSYVLGIDPQGGVFVSENFYYDSEIYNTKIYAVTDRPMYRPGDPVHVKFIGRTFQNATQSSAPAEADIKLDVLDPNGAPVATSKVHFASDTGADTAFTLARRCDRRRLHAALRLQRRCIRQRISRRRICEAAFRRRTCRWIKPTMRPASR